MAGSTGDIARVALKYTIRNIVMRNVFYYRVQDLPTAGYLSGLLTEFGTAVLTPISNLLTTAYTISELIATNIFSGDEVVNVAPTPAAGTRSAAGEVMPDFVAAMIILERQNSRVRNGRKFFPLPLEADSTGTQIVAGTITLYNNIAAGMDNTLNPGGVDSFAPAIVARIPYTTSSGRIAYRLPATQAEMGDNYSLSDTARLVARPTTMNSRKPWRGE